MRKLALALPILFIACTRDAHDPLSLAPETPYSSWTPAKKNILISSKYCQTLLPPTFETGEMQLSELIDIALQNNPTTKQTWAQARASAALYGQSLSAFYPNIEFSGFFFRQRAGFPTSGVPTDTPGTPTTISAGTVGDQMSYFTETGPDIQLSYTLFDFGQRTAASLAAREALYYADLSHNQQIQYVVQSVMNDYYIYLYQIALERANESNLQMAQMTLDAANVKFASGVAALGDVAQARTQFLQNRIQLTTQKQAVENAFAQLAVDLGLPANIPFRVKPMPEQVFAEGLLDDVETLVCIAQAQRQDLQALQAQLRSKEASLLQARRATLPVINTQLATGRYWYEQNNHEPKNHWTAVFGVTFPIFNGFSYRNQIKNAEANVELAKADLLQSELTIIQNVTTAHLGVKTAASNLKDSQEYLQAADLEFRIAITSYKAGTTTILDLINAQSNLADARAKKAESEKNWFLSLAGIAYATGSLCKI